MKQHLLCKCSKRGSMYQRSAAEKPRKDSAPFGLLEGESF